MTSVSLPTPRLTSTVSSTAGSAMCICTSRKPANFAANTAIWANGWIERSRCRCRRSSRRWRPGGA